MFENVTIQKYVCSKNIVYQLYPLLTKLSTDELESIFMSFGKLNQVARSTYLFPYDIELFDDIKNLTQETLLKSNLQEKYNISDDLLIKKYSEYKFYNFDVLLDSLSLLDIDSMKKFNYKETLGKIK